MTVTARFDGPTQTPAGCECGRGWWRFFDIITGSRRVCGEEEQDSNSAREESLRYCDRDKRGGVFLMPEKSDF